MFKLTEYTSRILYAHIITSKPLASLRASVQVALKVALNAVNMLCTSPTSLNLAEIVHVSLQVVLKTVMTPQNGTLNSSGDYP